MLNHDEDVEGLFKAYLKDALEKQKTEAEGIEKAAKEFKLTYDIFINVGFNEQQAFDLLLALIDVMGMKGVF